MHATIRSYQGVDQTRAGELTTKVNRTLVPQLQELPGFQGYYLVEAGNGIFTSFGLFETPEQGEGVDEARHSVDPGREARRADAKRAQDHQRQGRCSQP